jgi:hypothetical protein
MLLLLIVPNRKLNLSPLPLINNALGNKITALHQLNIIPNLHLTLLRNEYVILLRMIILNQSQNHLPIKSLPLINDQHVAQPITLVLDLGHGFLVGEVGEELDLAFLLLLEQGASFAYELAEVGVGGGVGVGGLHFGNMLLRYIITYTFMFEFG